MEAKEKLLDRMEQSFFVYKKGLFELTLPFFIYTFIGFFVVPVILVSIFYPIFSNIFDSGNDIYNYYLIYLFSLPVLFLVVFYIFSYIFVFILTIKNIIFYYQNYENDDKNNFKQQVINSRKNIFKIMKTYWYIFAYVALIPAILFIIGGLIFNATYFLELPDSVSRIGIIFMITGFILFVIFSIYRGVKTTFSLYNAIENNEFTKGNFSNSVELTNGIWWRIFGNTFISGVIVGLFFGVIISLVGFIIPSGNNFYELIFNGNYTYLVGINFLIYGLFESIINSISIVYLSIFVYLLYKRIFFEKNISNYDNKDDFNDVKEPKKI